MITYWNKWQLSLCRRYHIASITNKSQDVHKSHLPTFISPWLRLNWHRTRYPPTFNPRYVIDRNRSWPITAPSPSGTQSCTTWTTRITTRIAFWHLASLECAATWQIPRISFTPGIGIIHSYRQPLIGIDRRRRRRVAGQLQFCILINYLWLAQTLMGTRHSVPSFRRGEASGTQHKSLSAHLKTFNDK